MCDAEYFARIDPVNPFHGKNNDEWVTKDGRVLKIKDMSTAHIRNCMNMFGESDGFWKVFKEELDRRGEPVFTRISSYDPGDYGVHIVRVTFMYGSYSGHIAYKIGGNCKGLLILNTFDLDMIDDDDVSKFVENDCSFSVDDNYSDWFSMELHDGDRHICLDGLSAGDLSDYIVKIEIVGYEQKDKR